MKSNILSSAVRSLSLICLASASCALAQAPTPVHYTGVLNDYTPVDPSISGSPYEMHGQWSVDLDGQGNGNFYADMTMSDYGTTNGLLDGTKGGQNAHTHHIRLTNATVTPNMTGCPVYNPPVTTMGFQLNGTVSLITGNGGKAPFEPTTPPTSTLQVCITGGNTVPYSNMTMVFGGPAMNHFGTQAIHGVVRNANFSSTTSSVAIVSPIAGTSVSGVITVQGSINVNLDAAGSFLIVDGASQNQHRVTSAPYVYSLDTRTLSNGTHTLQLWAHDTGNNTTLSTVVQINVAN
jgi:Bacterial Ig domain